MENGYPVKPLALTVEEAAQALRCSPQFVRNLLNSGELKGQMVGRAWQVTEKSIVDWLERGQTKNGKGQEAE